MQISKCFLAVCAAAICIGPLTSRGDDTDAQAKARQALEEKLNELQPQPPNAAPQPPPTAKPAKKKAAPPPAPAPMREPPPVRMAPPPPPSATSPTIQPAPRSAAAPAPAKYRDNFNSATTPPAPSPAMVAPPPPADSETIARAREALERKLSELQGQEVQAQPQAEPERPVASPRPMRPADRTGFKPLPAPELPISTDKQQRLAVLLQRYKADQITPEQYHAERAKILNEQ